LTYPHRVYKIGVEGISMNDVVNVKIDGMHCGGCVRRVHAALAKVDGVDIRNVTVGAAQIAIDEQKAHVEDALEAVSNIGFSARVEGAEIR
jgi:copper chaperone